MTQAVVPSPSDRYLHLSGTVELTGVQALARMPMDVRRADRARGRSTAVYISGYEGSPLGGYDLELARQRPLLEELGIVFRPGVNEELAATAVQGTQLASSRPEKRVEGVVGIWYGKSPGLDRAADALRHGNLGGTHPLGGAVALVGDDPAAKSSTVPGASEQLLADLGLPILYPADPANALLLGLHAVELSRASGLWVALKIVTNVADGSGRVPILLDEFDPVRPEVEIDGKPYRHEVTAKLLQPALTPLEESRNGVRLEIARQYAATNGLNRLTRHPGDRIGIVAGGKTFLDLRQALGALGLDEEELARRGIRLLELRMIHPLEPRIVAAFAAGLREIIVVEEKRAFLESAIKDLLYGRTQAPVITGKTGPDGRAAFDSAGELDPDRIAEVLAARLLEHGDFPSVERWAAERRPRRHLRLLPLAQRTPYFCSGCPHNSSVKTPEGALVGGGIGCHGLVLGMAPEQVGEVTGLTQMGGEGAQWLGMAPFLDRAHLFQNLGDGTFHHSGSLAIRAAVAGGVNITYKLLHNAAVAMTGGQQAQGAMSVPAITHSLTAEGVARIIVTTENPKTYRRAKLAPGVAVWSRDRLVQAQETLAATPGVTVLIHDQECATELRRRRKRGLAADPRERVLINERICEGCGDCGRVSNCLSVHPVETAHGRKTRIDQSSCNKDYSCLDGDCPAFLTVTPRAPKARRRPTPPAPTDLPDPGRGPLTGHHTTRILGIGGSGVVTLSQILATAASLAGRTVATLDQTGLAQKGGAVVSDVKIGQPAGPVASKAAAEEVDLYLGADLLVAADPRNLTATHRTRTRAVVSTTRIPTGRMATDVTASYPDPEPLIADIRRSTRAPDAVFTDARALSRALFGDDQFANLFLTGIAYQLGELPIPASAIEQAVELNGVRVQENTHAFRWGRQYVADRTAFDRTLPSSADPTPVVPSAAVLRIAGRVALDDDPQVAALVVDRVAELVAYQSERYAQRYADLVHRVREREQVVHPGSTALTASVARYLHKLMAYKDEYEVARLALLPELTAAVEAEFGPGARYQYRLHPPTLRALGMKRKIRLGRWFRPVFAVLAAHRFLRGTRLDPFGHAEVRRVERRLIEEYAVLVDQVLAGLDGSNLESALALTEAPDVIRGYEHVKLANVERYRKRTAELLAAYTRGEVTA
ncbi:indolepyruvate ferredoxin oxidoreductase family protein (plasmid) [Embleya sp. NBC_00888]|uniref:indolepyruvate ferredoxin oxidoreductase family protein n=1 Tax=Embleya sp. NBC_00888 TaxID=2975960 RepID=UPI002F90B754|nr:indolepyruvate ferredoxin oxidoreductase family protein [Embleya sp. NBC_00888]